jgi:hypothetical protein
MACFCLAFRVSYFSYQFSCSNISSAEIPLNNQHVLYKMYHEWLSLVRVWNLVSHITRRAQTEGIWKQGASENIWN